MAQTPRKASVAEAPKHGAAPLPAAKEQLARGDVRGARVVLQELSKNPGLPEATRAEARELLARTAPDPVALITLAVVAVLVALSLVLGIFLHGR